MGEMLFDELNRRACKTGNGESCFRGRTVFDLTSVYEISPKWEDHAKSKIPKRPPSDHCFCEWTTRQDHEGRVFRMGADMWNYSEVARRLVRGFPKGNHVFSTRLYRKCIHRNKTEDAYRLLENQIEIVACSFSFIFNFDFSEVEMQYQVIDDPVGVRKAIGFTGINVCVPTVVNEELWLKQEFGNPRLAIMAFSLLNCRNVVTETIKGQPRPRKFIERNYPPYCSYKILKVQVPAKYVASQQEDDLSDDEEGEKKHVRLHVCRGHFKQMRSPRFKRQGEWYWVPQHLRGTKELGTIVKDYKLVDSSTNAKG